MYNGTSPYRDNHVPPSPSRWYRIKGNAGFIINLNDVYVCKWDRDSRGTHLIVALKHGGWWLDGFFHHNIRIYGDEATDLERALLNLGGQ